MFFTLVVSYTRRMGRVVCDECKVGLNHGPLWCAFCVPGRVLCAACISADGKGGLICRRCRDQRDRLKKTTDQK